MKMIFTSDLHGNKSQYNALFKYARKVKPYAIIIGGDLAPKGWSEENPEEYISRQRDFLKEELPLMVRDFKKECSSELFLILGNDDCKCNEKFLERHEELYNNINGKRIKIGGGLEIVGYSFVPITPFGIKDYEKYDLSIANEGVKKKYSLLKRGNYRLDGIVSDDKKGLKWKNFHFRETDEKKDSIQKDLKKNIFTENSERTIYVIHCPPYGTGLDVLSNGLNVGSFAIREFMEKNQPYLTLHGHIHESVDMSGRFKEKIGKTILLGVGNDNRSEYLSAIVFDAKSPENAKRVIIPCS